jgi:hypothetical protein
VEDLQSQLDLNHKRELRKRLDKLKWLEDDMQAILDDPEDLENHEAAGKRLALLPKAIQTHKEWWRSRSN